MQRDRFCSNPKQTENGIDCKGPTTQVFAPMGEWSEWSACTFQTCGDAPPEHSKARTRRCLNETSTPQSSIEKICNETLTETSTNSNGIKISLTIYGQWSTFRDWRRMVRVVRLDLFQCHKYQAKTKNLQQSNAIWKWRVLQGVICGSRPRYPSSYFVWQSRNTKIFAIFAKKLAGYLFSIRENRTSIVIAPSGFHGVIVAWAPPKRERRRRPISNRAIDHEVDLAAQPRSLAASVTSTTSIRGRPVETNKSRKSPLYLQSCSLLWLPLFYAYITFTKISG